MTIESLEHRRLFTVTVAENYPGFYEIDGDGSNDDIAVSVSQNNQSFSIDGNEYSNAYFISVFGNGGDDAISLVSTDGTGSVGAGIDAGEGNDTITLNFDGSVYAGEGNDSVYLSDSFRGEAHGGGGDDYMYISAGCVDAAIEGGDGDDYIDCSNNDYSVTIHGGQGNDTMIGSENDDVIYGDGGHDSLVGRGGNDTFYCYGDVIEGGSGYDILHGSAGNVSGIEETM